MNLLSGCIYAVLSIIYRNYPPVENDMQMSDIITQGNTILPRWADLTSTTVN